ncbi:TPA: hypothetical protein ACG0AN_000622 [Enterobacter kobei]
MNSQALKRLRLRTSSSGQPTFWIMPRKEAPRQVAQPELAEWISPSTLLNALHETAVQLVDLPERLAARGVPKQILEMPAIGFRFIPDKLSRWGLL